MMHDGPALPNSSLNYEVEVSSAKHILGSWESMYELATKDDYGETNTTAVDRVYGRESAFHCRAIYEAAIVYLSMDQGTIKVQCQNPTLILKPIKQNLQYLIPLTPNRNPSHLRTPHISALKKVNELYTWHKCKRTIFNRLALGYKPYNHVLSAHTLSLLPRRKSVL
jgi:hypothetical protein